MSRRGIPPHPLASRCRSYCEGWAKMGFAQDEAHLAIVVQLSHLHERLGRSWPEESNPMKVGPSICSPNGPKTPKAEANYSYQRDQVDIYYIILYSYTARGSFFKDQKMLQLALEAVFLALSGRRGVAGGDFASGVLKRVSPKRKAGIVFQASFSSWWFQRFQPI